MPEYVLEIGCGTLLAVMEVAVQGEESCFTFENNTHSFAEIKSRFANK